MPITKTIAAAAALAALTACAQSPDAIAPVAMHGAYDRVSCAEAATERAAVSQRLAALSAAQSGAVTGDAIGVLLLGVPLSSLSGGDKSGEIAAEKGKMLALDARLAGCR